MTIFRLLLSTLSLAAVLVPTVPASSSQDNPQPVPAADLSGLHDFDFLVGRWQVHHRRLKERLADNHEWVEFEGTCDNHPLMNGWGNVDDNEIKLPGGEYRGVGLRSYDSRTAQWTIWWLDSRSPSAAIDPAVKGHFENGVGSFYADDTLRDEPIRVRFTWSQITPTSAHWEQAFSPDAGKTWEVNWTMEFHRVP